MLDAMRLIARLTDENDSILWDPDFLRGGQSIGEKWPGGDNRFTAAVLELEGELSDRVRRVCRRNDSAREKRPKVYGCQVDVVGRVNVEDILSLPVPQIAETLAEIRCGLLHILKGVVSGGVECAVNHCSIIA